MYRISLLRLRVSFGLLALSLVPLLIAARTQYTPVGVLGLAMLLASALVPIGLRDCPKCQAPLGRAAVRFTHLLHGGRVFCPRCGQEIEIR